MPFAGGEIIDGNLDRMVAPRAGYHLPATRNFGEVFAVRNLDANLGRPAGRVHITRPQQNRIRTRLPARDIMRKAGEAKQRLRHRRTAG